ncbi:MAG: DUF2271 domain-containing protein [Akkermansiaceae bacterium]
MKKTILLYLSGISVSLAGNYVLEVEIPQINASEYHNPYIASWIENDSRDHIMDLAVWYQIAKGNQKSAHGTKWLKDMRKWWRVSGRNREMPVDGVSSPTKPPGKHRISLKEKLEKLPALETGEYTLYVEAAREVGGRELVSVKFTWDGTHLEQISPESISGQKELGEISIKNNQ